MCCKLTVSPVPAEVAALLLQIGMFTLEGALWKREVPEEGALVTAFMEEDRLILNLQPAISTQLHHVNKRIAASIYFEIAAKVAERVGGRIVQMSTGSPGCTRDGVTQIVVAEYPDSPMLFEKVCPGFQAVFLTSTP